ncbi:MAG TPA: TetR/AcrR family transcriptional regulator [Pseudonocardiaceae bacterium]|nr:TetR/AcrR family transcriptional regulator [Pseudonocardiaceae bacterium]
MTAGTARPGGRTARVRAAVLQATYAELVAHGYAGLTVENVAERAGVHKTTVYRRWESVDGLIADALEPGAADWTPPDTGSLEQDLIVIATELVRVFGDPEQRAVPEAVVVAAFQSSRAVEALRRFYASRHARAAQVVTRAIERGELPAGTDPVEVVRLTCAPVFYRVFITREPVDDAVGRRAAQAALVAARAGVLVSDQNS